MDTLPWKFTLRQIFLGLSLLLVPLAFGIYLLQNYLVTGNAFQFLVYQNQNWHQQFSIFFRTPAYQTDYLINAILSGSRNMVFGLWLPNLLAIVISLVIMLLSHRQLRTSYTAYFICYFFMGISTSWLLSAPRYLLGCFPLLIGLSLLTKKRWVDILVSIACLAGFVVYFYLFLSRQHVY